MKQRKAEKRFMDLNSAMRYFVSSDVYLSHQQLSNWLALFSDLISIQKLKQKRNCWHRIQKLKRLVGKTLPSIRIRLQTRNSAISQSS